VLLTSQQVVPGHRTRLVGRLEVHQSFSHDSVYLSIAVIDLCREQYTDIAEPTARVHSVRTRRRTAGVACAHEMLLSCFSRLKKSSSVCAWRCCMSACAFAA
jgi:hypothetical protein